MGGQKRRLARKRGKPAEVAKPKVETAFGSREIRKDYVLRELTEEEAALAIEIEDRKVFGHAVGFDSTGALSDRECRDVERWLKKLESAYRLNLGLFKGQRLIGCSLGKQISGDTFRMISSWIDENHRGRGLYSALLSAVLEHLRKLGFQIVVSRHYATDNRIIVPKMKAGFLISGFEISDQFGLLVHLSYFFNPVRRRALDFRSGRLVADDELASLFRFREAKAPPKERK
jgi:ribosomal protein S18 acetylase RimI-like enzyme